MENPSILKSWVEIDSRALQGNVRIFKKIISSNSLLGMVKCNAYGHGLVETARLCTKASIDWLSVDNLDEAIMLRRAGIKIPILIITYTIPSRIHELLKYRLSQVVSDVNILQTYTRVAKKAGKKIAVHLKIDTGMSRQGVNVKEISKIAKFLNQNQSTLYLEGILTHFASADAKSQKYYTDEQLMKFHQAIVIMEKVGLKPKYIHGFNTAATLSVKAIKEKEFMNLNRVGIGLYGLLPSQEFVNDYKKLGLKPVLSWKTRIIQVKNIDKGQAIGYGLTEFAKHNIKIAVLPVGYYDGLPRSYSSVGSVLIAGKRCRILGRISMNLCVVDISNLKRAPQVWDEAVIIGRQGKLAISADELANKTGSINYEIVTRINPLIPRIYL